MDNNNPLSGESSSEPDGAAAHTPVENFDNSTDPIDKEDEGTNLLSHTAVADKNQQTKRPCMYADVVRGSRSNPGLRTDISAVQGALQFQTNVHVEHVTQWKVR